MDCLKGLRKKKIRPNTKKIPDPDLHHLDGVIYGLDYAKNPQIKAAVKQFKYRFTQELADHFADLIAEKIEQLNMVKGRQIILIPVPLHKKRLNYRGFNQAEVIARAVQDRFKDKAEIVPLLKRVRHTDQQAKLDKRARHENLKGAFKISNQFCHSDRSGGMNTKFTHEQKNCSFRNNSVIFIVDDVCTTGSTLENCAQVLKSEFPIRVYGLVIARAVREKSKAIPFPR